MVGLGHCVRMEELLGIASADHAKGGTALLLPFMEKDVPGRDCSPKVCLVFWGE